MSRWGNRPLLVVSRDYFVEGGFLFHKPTKTIRDFSKISPSSPYMNTAEYFTVNSIAHELYDLKELLNIYADQEMMPFSAPTIFELSPKVTKKVYVSEKGFTFINYKKTPKKYQELAIQLDLVELSLNIGRNKLDKFMYYRETPEYALKQSTRMTAPQNGTRADGLTFYESNKINDINLTENDLTILKEYPKYKTKMTFLSKHLYKTFYDVADENFKDNFEMERIGSINTTKSSMNMATYELDMAINKFANVLYLLTVFPAFSFSPSVEYPSSNESSRKNLELYYSEISYNLINNDKYKELWHIILKLLMINWKQITDDNKNNNSVFAIPLFQYYRTVKAIKGWIFYSLFFYQLVKGDDELPFTTSSILSKNEYWLYLNNLEVQLNEMNLREPYTTELEPYNSKQRGLKGVYVNGKMLNICNIIFSYQTLRGNVDLLLHKLGNYFSGVSFPAYSIKELIKARHGDFNDSTLYDMDQFYNYIPDEYKGRFLVEEKGSIRNPEELLPLIKDISLHLLWIVHISINCALHFRDLVTLMHSGPDKNIFLDPQTNGLRIRFRTRSINHPNLPPVEYSLDPVTSKYLLHYLLIIPPILITHFERKWTATIEPIIIQLKEKLVNIHPYVVNYDKNNFFREMVGTFVFIDPETCTLPTRGGFNKIIAKLPIHYSLNQIEIFTAKELETGIRYLARKELIVPEFLEYIEQT